jgi:hypothetical protein
MCAEADHVGWPQTNEGKVMRKLIIIAASLAALAVPTAAMASAPNTPGGFGTERASNIQQFHTGDGFGNWGSYASDRAGDNGTINQDWMASHGFLPVESSLTTP